MALVATTALATAAYGASEPIACAKFQYFRLKIMKEGDKINEYRDFHQPGGFKIYRTLRKAGRERYETGNDLGEFWIITSQEVRSYDEDGLINKRLRLPCS